ncbi:MAG: hypothetical protein KZQ96_02965 [Candidatus Thiodiazotropha sp. (ex Lucinoma borealis)]|nr:hypothetical protein [Candidatus Thiodiazotropha sp. (ex Lucinoma borealis)]MCU7867406.1 hypothetical protein [Candidatus Thiodiazotropha sp. (ex Lucinoma borealis)]
MANTATFLLTIFYSLSMHLSILAGLNNLLAWIVLTVASLYAVLSYQQPIKSLFFVCFALIALFNVIAGYDFVIYLPPILVPSILLVLFAGSLFNGREAFITRIASKMSNEKLSMKETNYTRKVTWLWSGFFILIITETVFVTIFANKEVWSLFANIYNYVFIGTLFVLEYAFRIYYFKRIPSLTKIKHLTWYSHY